MKVEGGGMKIQKRDCRMLLYRSQHQGHELAAARDFQFAENSMKMLFYRWHAQARYVGDFLVALSVTNKARKFLLSGGKSGEMR